MAFRWRRVGALLAKFDYAFYSGQTIQKSFSGYAAGRPVTPSNVELQIARSPACAQAAKMIVCESTPPRREGAWHTCTCKDGSTYECQSNKGDGDACCGRSMRPSAARATSRRTASSITVAADDAISVLLSTTVSKGNA